MAFSLIANTSASGSIGFTTADIDTTGADLLVIMETIDDLYNTDPTDSKTNTWTQLTSYTQTNVRVRVWYSVPTSVGSGHNFTAPGAPFGSLFVAAFKGALQTAPNDQQNGANGFVNTLQPGSITPSEANELIVTVLGINAAGVPISINSGFTELGPEIDFGAADHYGGQMAYLIQTAAAAVNPTWTRTDTNGCAATQVSFKAAPSGVETLTLLGVG